MLICSGRKIFLTQRNHPPFEGYWTIPGGHQEYGEHPYDAAIREVKEEIGIDAKPTEFLGIYLEHFEDSCRQITVYLCQVRGTGRIRTDPDIGLITPAPDEVANYGWFSWDAAPSPRTQHLQAVINDYVMYLRGEL